MKEGKQNMIAKHKKTSNFFLAIITMHNKVNGDEKFVFATCDALNIFLIKKYFHLGNEKHF